MRFPLNCRDYVDRKSTQPDELRALFDSARLQKKQRPQTQKRISNRSIFAREKCGTHTQCYTAN